VIRLLNVEEAGKTKILIFALCGLSLTILFDLLTTLGFLIMTGITPQTIIAAYSFGAPFYLTHTVVNTLIFALVVPFMHSTYNKLGGVNA
jgi:hypothetical protein